MRKVWVIAVREYQAAVKSKSFIIGIVLLPIMMGGGFLAMLLFKDQVDLQPKHFAIVDHTPGQHFFPLLAKGVFIRTGLDSHTTTDSANPCHQGSLGGPGAVKERGLDLTKFEFVRSSFVPRRQWTLCFTVP